MPYEELRAIWEKEERVAKIKGWDFSHIRGRYEEDPHNNLKEQKKAFENIGFDLLRAEEAFGPIRFEMGVFHLAYLRQMKHPRRRFAPRLTPRFCHIVRQ